MRELGKGITIEMYIHKIYNKMKGMLITLLTHTMHRNVQRTHGLRTPQEILSTYTWKL